jgi:hypothetical protein
MVRSLLFQAACRHLTKLRPCRLPPISSTSSQPKPYNSRHPTLPSLALCPCMSTSVFLGAHSTPTHQPPLPTSLLHGRFFVSSSATPRTIKGTDVSMALAIGSSSLVMSHSTGLVFLLLLRPSRRPPRHSSS